MDQFELTRAEGHLKLLKIFHFVYGGLTLLGLGFLVLHYFMMNAMMKAAPGMAPAQPEGGAPAPTLPDPGFEEIMDIMIWIYLGLAVVFVVIGVLNLMSGLFMGQRKNRIFSIVMAGFNCLNIPLGTVLGIFTIIFLIKPPALVLYGEAESI